MGTAIRNRKYFWIAARTGDPDSEPTPQEKELLSIIEDLEKRLENMEDCCKQEPKELDSKKK